MVDTKDRSFGIDFIDPFFAIVISFGLTYGLFTENWFEKGIFPVGMQSYAQLLALVLAFLFVILSWWGYHVSIFKQPIRGFYRFAFDVVLVILYGILFVEFRSVATFVFILVIIFIIYLLWDLYKVNERKKTDQNVFMIWWSENRQRTTFYFLIGFSILWILTVHYLDRYPNLLISGFIPLGVAYVLTVFYRYAKRSNNEKQSEKECGMKIYISEPYSASDENKILTNVNAAIDTAIHLYDEGQIPYVPHLTYYIDQRAKQTNIKLEWNDYIKWDLPWLEVCDAVLVLGQSKGVGLEVKKAKELNKKIFYSVEEIPKCNRK